MNLVQGAPNPKRKTQLQHSSGGGKSKACIILRGHYTLKLPDDHDQYKWITKTEYNICIVDLKSDIAGIVEEDDGFTLVSPTFQIDCGADEQNHTDADAFCVLGQTLYMFEGSSYQEDPHAAQKSVFALDLTRTQTLNQRTTKLAKDGPLLKKIADMTFPKSWPGALPTPDGEKIVVFSRHRYTFELFEPANRSWEQLPSLIVERGRMSIRAYGFMQDSHKLLVQTDLRDGMYALDLANDKNCWVKLGSIYSGVEGIRCGCSFFETVEESRFCFVNSSGFHDLEEYVGEYYRDDRYSFGFVPHNHRSGDVSFGGEYYAALLDYGDEGECEFCHMEIESSSPDRAGQSCRTEINVCRVDLKSYKEMAGRLSLPDLRWADELKHSKTRIVKTHRFSLCFEGIRRLVYEDHLFFAF